MTDAGRSPKRRRRRSSKPGLDELDRAALGITPIPESAPPGAMVDASEHVVPGAGFDDRLPTEPKPWFTSLAADSPQAGVANEAPEAEDATVEDQVGEEEIPER